MLRPFWTQPHVKVLSEMLGVNFLEDQTPACATTPPFVTILGLLQRHALTSADRRKTATYLQSELPLICDLDHRDINAFYGALLEIYRQGPRAYQGFTCALEGTGGKARQRALHRQCFQQILRKLKPAERSKLRAQPKTDTPKSEFFRDFFTGADEDEDIKNVAWILWCDWLVCGQWDFAKTIIEANPYLAEYFAGWEPSDRIEALPAPDGVDMKYDGADDVDASEYSLADAPFDDCFIELLGRVEEARRTHSPAELREISTWAMELAEKIE
jgi:hypothetical protein